jgi:SAM-dependent methyltransferase
MDLKEIGNMSAEDERRHWWIGTRFLYIDKLLKLRKKDPSPKFHILEFGCGTAQNLWYAKKKSSQAANIVSSTGLDPMLPKNHRYPWQSETDQLVLDPKLIDKKADFALAMDVLEHVDDDVQTLKEWTEHMNDGSHILITVPAFQTLWSQHDVILEHRRRYTRKQLDQVAAAAGLKRVKSHYAFSFIFPLVYIIRKLQKSKKENTDLKLPPFIINQTLLMLGKIESFFSDLIGFGTSVVGIYKK